MNITIEGINKNNAHVKSEDLIITNTQSALDLMATVKYESGCSRIIIDKTAVVGDYSSYTSKPLKDFIYECNKGKDFFFVSNVSEAIERLSNV